MDIQNESYQAENSKSINNNEGKAEEKGERRTLLGRLFRASVQGRCTYRICFNLRSRLRLSYRTLFRPKRANPSNPQPIATFQSVHRPPLLSLVVLFQEIQLSCILNHITSSYPPIQRKHKTSPENAVLTMARAQSRFKIHLRACMSRRNLNH